MDPRPSLEAFRRWGQVVCDLCGKAMLSMCWRERRSQRYSVSSTHRWGHRSQSLKYERFIKSPLEECLFSLQMKVCTQNRTQDALTVQQRFGLGCVSGAAAHAAFYPLEVSEGPSTFTTSHLFYHEICDIENKRAKTQTRHIKINTNSNQRTSTFTTLQRLWPYVRVPA